MSLGIHAPETDLITPLPPAGEEWDPHTTHTHFFGFCVPEARIGVFTYIRYMPHFRLSQGGVFAYQGLENTSMTETAFQDYQITMPWPEIDGRTFRTANGLEYDFDEPGERATIRYRSPDGRCSIDVTATAVTPLAMRGHVFPGEEAHAAQAPGGSEQFMHMTGELVLGGERHAVDCFYIRDRSWRQVREETRNAVPAPLIWSPVYFDDDFAFNQCGIEAPEEPGPHEPTHHFAWICRKGELREVPRVHCRVLESHAWLHAPLAVEIEAEDDRGEIYQLKGEAIALAPLPAWPNLTAYDSVFRWEDGDGRIGHGVLQSMWSERGGQALKARRLGQVTTGA